MHPTFEYIVTVLILSLLIGFSFYSLNSMSSTQLVFTKESQLDQVANNLFNKILMTPGYPTDWGRNIYINESNLEDFGLASTTGIPYQLDVDKIMRLVRETGNTTNPLYISPEKVGSLTGLYVDGHWNYGFKLVIYSALNISIVPVNPDESPPSKYIVRVHDYLGRPASNAYVKGILYAAYVETGPRRGFKVISSEAYNYTSMEGITILNFDISEIPSMRAAYVVLVNAYYYGLKSQGIWTKASVLNLVIEGDYIIINMSTLGNIIPSARHLYLTAIEFTSNQGVILNPIENATDSEDGKIINKGRYNYRVYKLKNGITDDVVFIGLLIKTTGKYYIAFSPRPRIPIVLEYSSHSFSIHGLRTKTLYSLFKIGDYTYYVELYVWRMSE